MSKPSLTVRLQLLGLLVVTLLITSLLIKETVAPALGQAAVNEETAGLLIPIEGTQGIQVAPPQDDPRLVIERARAVQINWEHLGGVGQNRLEAVRESANPQLQLNLFPDLTLTAVLVRVDPNPSGGGYLWSGTVADVPNSLVQLMIKDQLLAGEVRLPNLAGVEGPTGGVVYQIRPTVDGLYDVRQIRMVAPAGPEKDYARPPWDTMGSAAPPASAGPQADDGSTIDVMVAYTPLVRQTVGGAAAMALEIDLAVSLTNQAYANSGINQRLRLVHAVEVNYSETSQWTDLNRMTNKNDGVLDELHGLRDQFGADVVTLLLKTNDSSSGIGWLLDELDPRFEAYAFNVTDICCATGGLVFAHELGHNMGAAHDWYVDADPGAFTYSHGYVEPSCGFKTIMAYGSQCQWFQPIANFSNPGVQHEGVTTGVQPGTNVGCSAGNRNNPPCDADNRLTLNNTAFTVANFRRSTGGPVPTATEIPPTATIIPPTPVPPSSTATATNTPVSTALPTNTPVNTTVPTGTTPATNTPVSTALPTNTPVNTTVPTGTAPATNTPVNTVEPTTPPETPVTPFPTCTPPAPTATPTSPSAPTPSLEITSGANIGAPGSHFIVVGQNFPPNTTLTLYINERELANVPTDGNGTFVVVLITLPATEAGMYRLSAGAAFNAAVTFTIDPEAPLIELPVSGQTVPMPEDVQPQSELFLPLIQKESAGTAAAGGTDPCDDTPDPIATIPPTPIATETATPVPTPTSTVPDVAIIVPAAGAVVPPSFELEIVTNWPVQPNGRHFHWSLDGADQGAVYTIDPILVNNLSSGSHTIVVQLAEADHQLIGVDATVTFTVQADAPPATPTMPLPTGGALSDLTIAGLAGYVEA